MRRLVLLLFLSVCSGALVIPAFAQMIDNNKAPKATRKGQKLFKQIGCAQWHIPDLQINHD
jgi:hypothetical protein